MDPVEEQLAELRERYPQARLERRPDGTALVRIPEYVLPDGWSLPKTEVRFVVPLGYPVASPDTFWADAELRLAGGGFPANTQVNANYGGTEPLLWFSHHPSTWNPSRDTLATFFHLIRNRLQEPR